MPSDSAPPARAGRELNDILAGIRPELHGVEELLGRVAEIPDIPLLGSVLGAVLAGPAKRLRPALALLSCDLLGARGHGPRTLAAATEVLHSATLVHDDIVDASDSRRGRPAIHVTWSGKVAVLAGDYLFATAAALVAELDRPSIVRMFADTIHRMSRSEFVSPAYGRDAAAAREQYLTKIGAKTASLFALATGAAGELAGAKDGWGSALQTFGWSLGMSFQITDDILDVSGESGSTGKPVGGDLREGVLTLPVILYLSSTPHGDDAVRRVVAGDARGDEDVAAALRLVRESSAVHEARRVAADYAADSRRALQELPDGPARTAMDELAAHAAQRSS